MGFRLANINGRTALVDADGDFYDIAEASDGALGPDPMDAIAGVAALHALGARLGHRNSCRTSPAS